MSSTICSTQHSFCRIYRFHSHLYAVCNGMFFHCNQHSPGQESWFWMNSYFKCAYALKLHSASSWHVCNKTLCILSLICLESASACSSPFIRQLCIVSYVHNTNERCNFYSAMLIHQNQYFCIVVQAFFRDKLVLLFWTNTLTRARTHTPTLTQRETHTVALVVYHRA